MLMCCIRKEMRLAWCALEWTFLQRRWIKWYSGLTTHRIPSEIQSRWRLCPPFGNHMSFVLYHSHFGISIREVELPDWQLPRLSPYCATLWKCNLQLKVEAAYLTGDGQDHSGAADVQLPWLCNFHILTVVGVECMDRKVPESKQKFHSTSYGSCTDNWGAKRSVTKIALPAHTTPSGG